MFSIPSKVSWPLKAVSLSFSFTFSLTFSFSFSLSLSFSLFLSLSLSRSLALSLSLSLSLSFPLFLFLSFFILLSLYILLPLSPVLSLSPSLVHLKVADIRWTPCISHHPDGPRGRWTSISTQACEPAENSRVCVSTLFSPDNHLRPIHLFISTGCE